MQKIKVNRVEPTGRDGTAIFDENGARFSGFQPELKYVRAGDTVGIEVEVNGKYNNITAVKALQRGMGQRTAALTGGNNCSGEQGSIEAQVAFKGIIELVCHLPAEGKLGAAYEKALDWAVERLGRKAGPGPVQIAIRSPEKASNNDIDMAWLKEALQTLQDSGIPGWSNAAVTASLNRTTGGNAKSVSEAARLLNRKQAEKFVREIRAAMNKG
jgi:hypothetical protein